MTEYQVIARKYRPQRFRDVVGQEAIVTTLKNMIRLNRVAHAYLFCGSRGTGKTTLARLFAKALNCQSPGEDLEPCNVCSSCKEITAGYSLDILEIDGASNRGIEDVRKITETVGYSTASSRYKIFIIDEVHMLTKEAFNALLKTLEEPPANVKFFFATTEPHKVLPTILSRCQRFNLNRISANDIHNTLEAIVRDLNREAEPEALRLISAMADGGLRDAESLLDQVLSFHEGLLTLNIVADILGVTPRDCYFDIDKAGKEGNLARAFEIVQDIYAQGKDLLDFVNGLVEHFRNLLVVKLSGKDTPLLNAHEGDRVRYEQSAQLYRKEQCLYLLDYLVELQGSLKFAASSRIALETALLHVMRSHERVPVEHLVKELVELEKKLQLPEVAASSVPPPAPVRAPQAPTVSPAAPKTTVKTAAPPAVPQDKKQLLTQQSRYDTVTQFAAIELGGVLQKTALNGT